VLSPNKTAGKRNAKFMAGDEFKFLLLTFQYLVGWGIFNLVISMNLFRFQQLAGYRCQPLARKC
jgi:hypothetical protein